MRCVWEPGGLQWHAGWKAEMRVLWALFWLLLGLALLAALACWAGLFGLADKFLSGVQRLGKFLAEAIIKCW